MERRLSAILAADMVGYSRLMEADEIGVLERQKAHRSELIDPAFKEFRGRIVKEMGDGILVEFSSVVQAVQCAVAIQRDMPVREADETDDRRIEYRIGINLGDIVIENDDIFGDGVNIAARLEQLAEPGGICISGTAYDQMKSTVEVGYESLGDVQVKNIGQPVRAYRVLTDADQVGVNLTKPRRRLMRSASIAAVALFILAIGAGGWWWQPWKTNRSAPTSQTSTASSSTRLAVLPFRNISDDQKQDFFALGLAEDLIADLTKLGGIGVISRASSFQYRDASISPQDIARRLDVRYLVGGSIRRASDELRISVDLVDITTGTTIWAERFDGTNDDVFEFQDRISAQIVKALNIALAPAQKNALYNRGTHSPQAFEAYLRGLRAVSELKPLDNEGNSVARNSFQRAIELDPGFAKAYAGLAWSNWLHSATIDFSAGEGKEAFELAERSISLADNALARRTIAKRYYHLIGYVKGSRGRDLDRALQELRSAADLEPGNADILADLAGHLAIGDGAEEGLRMIDRAMTLNPNHAPWYQFSRGLDLLFLSRYSEAVDAIRTYTQTNPTWSTPYIFLAVALALDGKDRLAQIALSKFENFGSTYRKTRKGFIFRQWPMAPKATKLFTEGLEILGVPQSVN